MEKVYKVMFLFAFQVIYISREIEDKIYTNIERDFILIYLSCRKFERIMKTYDQNQYSV